MVDFKTSMKIELQKYSPALIDGTVATLADAFVTNPLHISAFGPNRLDQNRLFFRIGLRHMFVGAGVVALVDDVVRGYVHHNPWPHCLPAPEQVPTAAATVLKPLGDAIPKIVAWFARWSHLDPDEPHIHLGPIGVSPEFQGQGIGSALMNRYIEHLAEEEAAGYLETDRQENVKFYEKFGFRVTREEDVIGAHVWYMWRNRVRSG
jgi:ribosomal protein S18 acetylase RimI-like enzyme